MQTIFRRILLFRSLFGDKRTPVGSKIMPWAALIYALSPIDLAPDIIPLIGQLDDIGIVILLLWLAYRAIPKSLINEHWNRLRNESIDVTPGRSQPYNKR